MAMGREADSREHSTLGALVLLPASSAPEPQKPNGLSIVTVRPAPIPGSFGRDVIREVALPARAGQEVRSR
jgi:hypothetical protein